MKKILISFLYVTSFLHSMENTKENKVLVNFTMPVNELGLEVGKNHKFDAVKQQMLNHTIDQCNSEQIIPEYLTSKLASLNVGAKVHLISYVLGFINWDQKKNINECKEDKLHYTNFAQLRDLQISFRQIGHQEGFAEGQQKLVQTQKRKAFFESYIMPATYMCIGAALYCAWIHKSYVHGKIA